LVRLAKTSCDCIARYRDAHSFAYSNPSC
jgi:hypothetical protein